MLNEFCLPMTLTHLSLSKGDKHIVHNLDFDLVEIAASEDEAWERLTHSIRAYVEFGLGKGWKNCILHKAPTRYWDLLADLPARFMEPITVANCRAPVVRVELDEAVYAA
jgi:hypothetical protein